MKAYVFIFFSIFLISCGQSETIEKAFDEGKIAKLSTRYGDDKVFFPVPPYSFLMNDTEVLLDEECTITSRLLYIPLSDTTGQLTTHEGLDESGSCNSVPITSATTTNAPMWDIQFGSPADQSEFELFMDSVYKPGCPKGYNFSPSGKDGQYNVVLADGEGFDDPECERPAGTYAFKYSPAKQKAAFWYMSEDKQFIGADGSLLDQVLADSFEFIVE